MLKTFKLGRWVKIKQSGDYGFVIFIHETAGVKVRYKGNQTKLFDPKQLELADDIIRDDQSLHNLQLLALNTNDEEWFNELGVLRSRLKELQVT